MYIIMIFGKAKKIIKKFARINLVRFFFHVKVFAFLDNFIIILRIFLMLLFFNAECRVFFFNKKDLLTLRKIFAIRLKSFLFYKIFKKKNQIFNTAPPIFLENHHF